MADGLNQHSGGLVGTVRVAGQAVALAVLAAAVSIAFVFAPDRNLLAMALGMMGWGLSFAAF